MFLTLLLTGAGLLVAGEGVVAVRDRYRHRHAWEPSFREMWAHRTTEWKMVGELRMEVAELKAIYKDKGMYGLDSHMFKVGKDGTKWGTLSWHQWSINWRHGCLDRDGARLEAGWCKESGATYATVYFYDTWVEPPKKAPVPEPEPAPVVKSLWSPADELRNILSFLRSPAAFWLAPEGKVPVLRFYESGKIVVCENGASTSRTHADLIYDETKKLPYIVITDDDDGWKKKRCRTMDDAEKAIATYFERRVGAFGFTYKQLREMSPVQRLTLVKTENGKLRTYGYLPGETLERFSDFRAAELRYEEGPYAIALK